MNILRKVKVRRYRRGMRFLLWMLPPPQPPPSLWTPHQPVHVRAHGLLTRCVLVFVDWDSLAKPHSVSLLPATDAATSYIGNITYLVCTVCGWPRWPQTSDTRFFRVFTSTDAATSCTGNTYIPGMYSMWVSALAANVLYANLVRSNSIVPDTNSVCHWRCQLPGTR